MFLFDLHCDTLTAVNARNRGLMNDGFAVSIDKPPAERWCQCFAIFVPDELRGAQAVQYFESSARFFQAQMNLHSSRITPVRTLAQMDAALNAGKIAAMLTVEGGAALGGDLQNAKKLACAGVRMLTLTWNGANELAGGCEDGGGFTFFGRMAAAVLEQDNIVLDVSHLSDKAFWDLAGFAKRPFVASHSNSRTICNHERNLTDEQFLHIVKIGGIVGINFYPQFVSGESDASFDMLAEHIEHFLKLGGEEAIALGSDFDGAQMPSWLGGVSQMPLLFDKLCERFGQAQAQLICGGNALSFFKRYDALGVLLEALRT